MNRDKVTFNGTRRRRKREAEFRKLKSKRNKKAAAIKRWPKEQQ